MKGPLVSVIVTCYNVAQYIESTLDSWARQSYQNIEIVVVDDASQDETLRTVEAYALREPRVRVVKHEINGGAHAARMTGLNAVRGGYFIFCDGDDWVHESLVARCLGAIGDADCIMFQHEEVDHNSGLALPSKARREAFNKALLASTLTAKHLGLLTHITPVCFFQIGFKDRYKQVFSGYVPAPYFEDLPSFAPTVDCNLKLIPDVLYFYRVNRPGQSIEDWWEGERALKYHGLSAAFGQMRKSGLFSSKWVKHVMFYKLLNITYCEIAGLSGHNPGEAVRLKKVVVPEFRAMGTPWSLWINSPFLAVFLLLFRICPSMALPGGLRSLSKIKKALKKL